MHMESKLFMFWRMISNFFSVLPCAKSYLSPNVWLKMEIAILPIVLRSLTQNFLKSPWTPGPAPNPWTRGEEARILIFK